MRIQRTIFCLDLQLKHSECNGKFQLDAFDQAGNLIELHSVKNNGIETVSLHTTMPAIVMLTLTGKDYTNDTKFDSFGSIVEDKTIELVGMSLMGIRFNFKNLEDLAVYFPDRSSATSRSFAEYNQLYPKKSLVWNRNGCIKFNFFACDPITYHLNVGTMIRF